MAELLSCADDGGRADEDGVVAVSDTAIEDDGGGCGGGLFVWSLVEEGAAHCGSRFILRVGLSQSVSDDCARQLLGK